MRRAISHRCEGSLQASCSIREHEPKYANTVYYGWHLFTVEHDFGWGTHYLKEITKIDYCPFCGKKLERSKYEYHV